MAKFTSKNIEFKDGQKAIFGTEDDAYITWDNNQLQVSSTLSGVTPTEDGHLTTKGYVDADVFGNEYQYAESEAEDNTGSATFQNKLTLTTPVIPAGDYHIQWYMEMKSSASNRDVEYQVDLDAGTIIGGAIVRLDDYMDFSGHKETTFTAGSHTVELDFRRITGGGTCYVQRARISMWRVS